MVQLMNTSLTDPACGPLARSVALLRILATVGPSGAALSELTQQTGLAHATAHRLLRQLVAHRLVRRSGTTRRYSLGALSFELGLAAAYHFDIRDLARPAVDSVALESGHTTYLVTRSGYEAVCLDRREGPSPVKVLTLQIGSRRPLGVGAGGLAILAALDEDERNAAIEIVKSELHNSWGISEAQLHNLVQATIDKGYALIRNRVTPGVSALGWPIHDSLGRPFAAISIATASSQMTTRLIDRASRLLQRRAGDIEERLRSSG
jgi:DNA-binding IclR family transcriptional regulator